MIKKIMNTIKKIIKGEKKMKNEMIENQTSISNKKAIKNAVMSFALMAFDYIDYNYLDKMLGNIYKRLKIRDKGDEYSVKSINLFYELLPTGKAHMDIEPYIFVAYKINQKHTINNNYIAQYGFVIGELHSIKKIDNLKEMPNIIFSQNKKPIKNDIKITNDAIYKFKNGKVKIYKIIVKSTRQYSIKELENPEKNYNILPKKDISQKDIENEQKENKIKELTQKIVSQIKGAKEQNQL